MERFYQRLQGSDHLHAETHHHSAGEQCAGAPHAPQLGLAQVGTTETSAAARRKGVSTSSRNSRWSSFRRTNWIKAVQMCSKAREFALALAILECAIKPVAMLPVWKDSLGHTRYAFIGNNNSELL